MFKTLFATSALLGCIQAVKLTETTTLPDFNATPVLAEGHATEIVGGKKAFKFLADDSITDEEKLKEIGEFVDDVDSEIPEEDVEAKAAVQFLKDHKEILLNWLVELRSFVKAGDKEGAEGHWKDAENAFHKQVDELDLEDGEKEQIVNSDTFKIVAKWVHKFYKASMKMTEKNAAKQEEKLAQEEEEGEMSKKEKLAHIFMTKCQNHGMSEEDCKAEGEALVAQLKAKMAEMSDEEKKDMKKMMKDDPEGFVNQVIEKFTGAAGETDGAEKPCPMKKVLEKACKAAEELLGAKFDDLEQCLTAGKEFFQDPKTKQDAIDFLKEVLDEGEVKIAKQMLKAKKEGKDDSEKKAKKDGKKSKKSKK